MLSVQKSPHGMACPAGPRCRWTGSHAHRNRQPAGRAAMEPGIGQAVIEQQIDNGDGRAPASAPGKSQRQQARVPAILFEQAQQGLSSMQPRNSTVSRRSVRRAPARTAARWYCRAHRRLAAAGPAHRRAAARRASAERIAHQCQRRAQFLADIAGKRAVRAQAPPASRQRRFPACRPGSRSRPGRSRALNVRRMSGQQGVRFLGASVCSGNTRRRASSRPAAAPGPPAPAPRRPARHRPRGPGATPPGGAPRRPADSSAQARQRAADRAHINGNAGPCR